MAWVVTGECPVQNIVRYLSDEPLRKFIYHTKTLTSHSDSILRIQLIKHRLIIILSSFVSQNLASNHCILHSPDQVCRNTALSHNITTPFSMSSLCAYPYVGKERCKILQWKREWVVRLPVEDRALLLLMFCVELRQTFVLMGQTQVVLEQWKTKRVLGQWGSLNDEGASRVRIGIEEGLCGYEIFC